MAELNKEQLQEQNAQLKKDLEATSQEKTQLAGRVDSLSEALTNANRDKAELQQQLTDERTRSGEVAGELNESEQLVEELQAQLKRADARQAQSDTVIVSDGTHDYKVLAPKFKYKHVEYTAEQLRTDEALVQELVAAGVGFLHKIEAGE
ncbi:MAG: hypothetical protein ACRYFX_19670 [Janthinobacterium lividum]